MNELEEIRKQMNADDTHMLVPTVYIGQANPLYSITAIKVQVDTKENSNEIYKVGAVKRGSNFIDMYALGKPALEKFAAAAGISINSCNSYTRMLDENTFVGHVEAALLTPDGSPRLMTNEKAINMSVIEKSTYEGKKKAAGYGFSGKEAKRLSSLYKGEWKDAQYGSGTIKKFFISNEDIEHYLKAATAEAMVQQWKDAPQKAWTGAWLRLIRSALNMRPTYTLAELSKPFVITRLNFKPDYSDPLVRRMALEQGFRSMGMMYGDRINAQYTDISNQKSLQGSQLETPSNSEDKTENIINDGNDKESCSDNKHFCADCGAEIVLSKQGVNIEQICRDSVSTFGRELCAKCMKNVMKAATEMNADPSNIYICGQCHKPVNMTEYLSKHKTVLPPILDKMKRAYNGKILCPNCIKKLKKSA